MRQRKVMLVKQVSACCMGRLCSCIQDCAVKCLPHIHAGSCTSHVCTGDDMQRIFSQHPSLCAS